MNRLAAGWIAVLLVLGASSAHAQHERFLEGVAELTAAVAAPDDEKPARFTAALARMTAGLDAWDRALEGLASKLASTNHAAASVPLTESRVAIGRLYLARGRFADALRAFDAAMAIAPDRPDIHVLRALALDGSGDHEASRTALRTAWRLAPSDPIGAYQALAREALLDPAEAARARGVFTDAYRAIVSGAHRFAATRFPIATALPDSASNAPVLPDLTTGDVFRLLAQQKYGDAVAALRRALASPPVSGDSSIDRFLRGRAHEAGNRISEARREYQLAVEPALAGRSVLYAGIGRLARLEGDFAGALEAFTTAVRLNPNDPARHKDLARAYLEQDRPEDAFPELVTALLLDPLDAWAHATVGQLYLDAGRHADAVTALTHAVTLEPETHDVRYALATALARVGRTDEAARELRTFHLAQEAALEKRRRALASGVQ